MTSAVRHLRLALAAPALLAALPTTTASAPPPDDAIAVFAGGCFWGVEWVFEHVRGVRSAESGYAGGTLQHPTYEQVGTGRTGHAESVRIVFDPEVVSYRQLLEIFFFVAHDPTSLDRQGPDVGSDYRAIVFAQDSAQLRDVKSFVAELSARREFGKPIVTEIRSAQPFYLAEEYHQNYASRHPDQPYIVVNDAPKVRELQRRFPALFKR